MSSSVGSIARNFHEGTRSEYIAQYVLSAFGTAVPVPHPEDSGVDLHCSLGRRIGIMLHVENYYLVQVKSTDADIIFEGRSIQWLLSHRYPLLFCVVNKAENRVRIFHTLYITLLFSKTGINRITLQFREQENVQQGDRQQERDRFFVEIGEAVEVRLGRPILDFNLSEMSSNDRIESIAAVLEQWIRLDQSNIDQKEFGAVLFQTPRGYNTNERFSPDQMDRFGNFADNEGSPALYERLYLHLAMLALQATRRQDIGNFEIIGGFVQSLLAREPFRYSNCLRALGISIVSGCQHLGIEGIVIVDSTGAVFNPDENFANRG